MFAIALKEEVSFLRSQDRGLWTLVINRGFAGMLVVFFVHLSEAVRVTRTRAWGSLDFLHPTP